MVDDGNLTTSVASRIICELERIYGVRQGSAGKSDPTLSGGTTQEDIAKE